MVDLTPFASLVPGDHGLWVLSTIRGDGSVQSSLVSAGVLDHPITREPVVGLATAGGTHDDWDTYDRVMAEERRTAALVTPTRVYGNLR